MNTTSEQATELRKSILMEEAQHGVRLALMRREYNRMLRAGSSGDLITSTASTTSTTPTISTPTNHDDSSTPPYYQGRQSSYTADPRFKRINKK